MRQAWDLTAEMFLSEDEVRSLLESMRRRIDAGSADERMAASVDQLIVESLLFSGLRTTEFCRLELRDTFVGQGESVFVVRGGRKSDRVVHVPLSVSHLVEHYVNSIRPQFEQRSRSRAKQKALVLNERGRPYERTGLYRRVVRILTDAGLGDRASVQLLRHTYGFLAYKRSGGNLLFVQRQLGHAHPMVTSVYAQFVIECYGTIAESVGAENKAELRRVKRAKRKISQVGE